MFDELKEDNRLQEPYNVKYFKVIKRLNSLHKLEAYLEPKRASTMEFFCKYNQRLTIFTIKNPSQMFDWVI